MVFDISKYQVKGDTKDVELDIGEDAPILLKVREIPWNKRQQILSDAMHWDSAGNTKVSMSTYNNECLKYMIVEAPWGATTETLLISLGDNVLSSALATIVPKAFGGEEDADETKKEEVAT